MGLTRTQLGLALVKFSDSVEAERRARTGSGSRTTMRNGRTWRGVISRDGRLGEVSHFPSPGDGDLHRGVGYRFRLPRHSHGGILKHKRPTPAGAGRGSSAAGREQQGDRMTVEELHDGRGEVLKHTSSALAGERTPLCTLCGMCRLQSNKGSDAHSDFRITILLLAEGRNCNPTKWRS